MEKLEIYVQQHNEIAQVIQEAYEFLDPAILAKDTAPALELLGKLEEKLMTHLKLENVSLYPMLMERKDERSHAFAAEIQADTSNLIELFETYLRAWRNSDAIQRNPQDFITATKQIFQAIARRINRDNNLLFPYIEKLH